MTNLKNTSRVQDICSDIIIKSKLLPWVIYTKSIKPQSPTVRLSWKFSMFKKTWTTLNPTARNQIQYWYVGEDIFVRFKNFNVKVKSLVDDSMLIKTLIINMKFWIRFWEIIAFSLSFSSPNFF